MSEGANSEGGILQSKLLHVNLGVWRQEYSLYRILVSYSTVVLYIGIMKVRGLRPKIITPKSA